MGRISMKIECRIQGPHVLSRLQHPLLSAPYLGLASGSCRTRLNSCQRFAPQIAPSPIRRFAVSPLGPAAIPTAGSRYRQVEPILALNPGSDYPGRILGKLIHLIEGQPKMICH